MSPPTETRAAQVQVGIVSLAHQVEVLSGRLLACEDRIGQAQLDYNRNARLLAQGDPAANVESCLRELERATALSTVIRSQLDEARAQLDKREGAKAAAQRHEQSLEKLRAAEKVLEASKLELHRLQSLWQSLPTQLAAENQKFNEALRTLDRARQEVEVH